MTKRDYEEEYRKYHSSEKAKKARAARNAARREAEKKYGKRAIAGKDVDHKQALAEGGSNAPSNLRVLSVHENRGRNNNNWRKKKK